MTVIQTSKWHPDQNLEMFQAFLHENSQLRFHFTDLLGHIFFLTMHYILKVSYKILIRE